jgi:hypothetical protein
MVTDNKQNRRYKQNNFIGLQNNRHPSQHTVGTPLYSPDVTPAGAISGEYSGLLSVSASEEHHERRTFCRRGGNPRMCDSGSAIDS